MSRSIRAELPFETPPSRLCVFEHPEETCEFFEGIRRGARLNIDEPESARPKNIKYFRNPKKLPRIRRVSDFSRIEWVSTSAALVMTAEYDRVRIAHGRQIPTIDLHDWHEGVFSKLYEVGFFEVLELSNEATESFFVQGNVRSMRIISGNRALIGDVAASLENLFRATFGEDLNADAMQLLLDALGEAMINAAEWAYPDNHEFTYRHVEKWWATASIDVDNRLLTVAIYDQGASIPATYSRKKEKWTSRARSWFERVKSPEPKFEFAHDGEYIAAAALPGQSNTGEENRGHGLPEMRALADIREPGTMKIVSRGGYYRYDSGRSPEYESRPYSIGGTLLEWRIPLRELAGNA